MRKTAGTVKSAFVKSTLLCRIKTAVFISQQGCKPDAQNFPGVFRYLEPTIGFEPTTLSLRMKCSTSWAKLADERLFYKNNGSCIIRNSIFRSNAEFLSFCSFHSGVVHATTMQHHPYRGAKEQNIPWQRMQEILQTVLFSVMAAFSLFRDCSFVGMTRKSDCFSK